MYKFTRAHTSFIHCFPNSSAATVSGRAATSDSLKNIHAAPLKVGVAVKSFASIHC